MKRILHLILIFIFLTSKLIAQSYIEQQDSLFRFLDKKEIATGALYDRVYPWAGLNITPEDSQIISYSFIQQAWYELILATYNSTNLMTIDSVSTKIKQNTEAGKGISLGYIDYTFNTIDTNAFASGSLYYDEDSILHRGAGGTPYLTQTATYPLISAEGLSGDSAYFYFDPDIKLTNTGREVDKIYLES
ncbi:MAG TPA: hypothetical protein PKX92_02020 [Edaphocola sp.]|nr:hypothetical protein [Edaphocola sp.]